MDVIGDTELAVSAYLEMPAASNATGLLYLRAYGLLQVLFVQQDALKNLAESIGCPYSLPATLVRIRAIRNDAIGHPSKRGGLQSKSFGIVRNSLSHAGFTLYPFDFRGGMDDSITVTDPDSVSHEGLTQYPSDFGGEGGFRTVRLLDLIAEQQEAVCNAIEQFVCHLQGLQNAESDTTP